MKILLWHRCAGKTTVATSYLLEYPNSVMIVPTVIMKTHIECKYPWAKNRVVCSHNWGSKLKGHHGLVMVDEVSLIGKENIKKILQIHDVILITGTPMKIPDETFIFLSKKYQEHFDIRIKHDKGMIKELEKSRYESEYLCKFK